jgi:hypothetical protein
MSWWKIGCLGLIVVAGIGFLALNELVGNTSGDIPIDGIKCGDMAVNGYHVHAHLTLLNRGQQVYLYDGIGRSQTTGCYYWLHTHDSSGVIHVESRDKFYPTLGTFFDIWGRPLSRSQFLSYTAKPGETMKVYVNQKPYRGNLHDIVLERHTTVTIEIGPPFRAPKPYSFGKL